MGLAVEQHPQEAPHPQFAKVLEAFAAGQTDQEIAAWIKPAVNRTTIWRWRKRFIPEREKVLVAGQSNVARAVARALQHEGLLLPQVHEKSTVQVVREATERALSDDPFVARINELRRDRSRIKTRAESSGDLRTWSALDRNDLTELELHAKLSGRLDAAPRSASINFFLMPASAGEPIEATDVEFTELDK